MSCLPKPVLRGHVKKHAIKTIVAGLSIATLNGSLYYFLVRKPKEKIWDDFLKNYDDEAHFKDLLKWGYLEISTKDLSE